MNILYWILGVIVGAVSTILFVRSYIKTHISGYISLFHSEEEGDYAGIKMTEGLNELSKRKYVFMEMESHK